MPEEKIRINKLLSDAGVCSRREADRLVEQGRVTVDGKVLAMGTRVSPTADIRVNGKPIRKEEKGAADAQQAPGDRLYYGTQRERQCCSLYELPDPGVSGGQAGQGQ